MSLKLQDDFLIMLGGNAQDNPPGVGGGLWFDLAKLREGGGFALYVYPESDLSVPVPATTITQKTVGTNSTQLTLEVVFAANSFFSSGPRTLVMQKGKGGTQTFVVESPSSSTPVASKSHMVDFSGFTLIFGTWVFQFWNGYDVVQTKGWRVTV